MKKTYVMIHVIKHDMDLNSYLSNSRKIAPVYTKALHSEYSHAQNLTTTKTMRDR